MVTAPDFTIQVDLGEKRQFDFADYTATPPSGALDRGVEIELDTDALDGLGSLTTRLGIARSSIYTIGANPQFDATVDVPYTLIDQETGASASGTIVFVIGDGIPDQIDYVVTDLTLLDGPPETWRDNQLIDFTVEVRNDGSDVALPTEVSLILTGVTGSALEPAIRFLDQVAIPPLGPGQSGVFSGAFVGFESYAEGLARGEVLAAVADISEVIPETDEDNNALTYGNETSGPSDGPNLAITDFRLLGEVADQWEFGDEIRWRVEISNTGDAPAGDFIIALLGSRAVGGVDRDLGIDDINFFEEIPAGGATTFTDGFTVDEDLIEKIGDGVTAISVFAEADFFNTVEETNEADNVSQPLAVRVGAGVDYRVTSFSFPDFRVAFDEAITLTNRDIVTVQGSIGNFGSPSLNDTVGYRIVASRDAFLDPGDTTLFSLTADLVPTGNEAGSGRVETASFRVLVDPFAAEGIGPGTYFVFAVAVSLEPEGDTANNLSIEYMVQFRELLVKQSVQTVASMWEVAYGRMAAETGLNFWVGKRADGFGEVALARKFLEAEEFTARFGDADALSDRAFIELLFFNLLGRPGQEGGIGFWLDRLADGASRAEVVLGFAKSVEFQAGLPYLETLTETDPERGIWAFGDDEAEPDDGGVTDPGTIPVTGPDGEEIPGFELVPKDPGSPDFSDFPVFDDIPLIGDFPGNVIPFAVEDGLF